MTKAKKSPLQHNVNMLDGSIIISLVRFSLPLLAGNLFQQLYNMVDTWVIGQTGESSAYAAVGSVGPIINILVGFFSGFATGAGVVIAQYYGAHNDEKVKKATHTAITATIILAVVFTALGIFTAPYLLKLMLRTTDTTDGIFAYGREYLTIYFAGISGLMFYNIGSGILRAVGDSDRPFYYLIVSAVTNIILDLLFVFVFKMGVIGVAYATIIAQFISAALVLITLARTTLPVKLSFRDLQIDFDLLKKTVIIALPAGLQLALTAFSNLFVQSYIANVNGDQTFALGGWTTYTKIDQFIFLPIQSIALAVTTFVGQNLGFGNVKRAKKGTYIAYGMATVVTVFLIVVIIALAPQLARIFNNDPNVVKNATLLLHNLTPFYVMCCVNQIFSASLRGAGNSRAPMIIMLASFVGFRQLYLFVMTNYISNDLLPVALGYPAGWFACCVIILIYFFTVPFGKKKLI